MRKSHRSIIFITITILLMSSSVLSVLHLRTFKEYDFIEMSKLLTDQTTTIFELWIIDQVNHAKQIANNEDVIKVCLDPNDLEARANTSKYLNNLQDSYPYYENLPIAIQTDETFFLQLDNSEIEIRNGEFIIDTADGNTIGKGGIEYSYIKEVLDGKDFYISEIYNSITSGNPILVISYPIKYEDEVIGVSIVSPKMNYLTEFFVDSISIADSGYMFVIDDSYSTIAHKERDLILRDTDETIKIIQYITEQIDNNNFFFEANLYNNNKYYYGKKVPLPSNNIENNIYVVVTQDKIEVYRRVHIYAAFSIIFVILIALLTYKVIFLINSNHLNNDKKEQLLILNRKLEEKVLERTLSLEDMAKRDSMTSLYNHEYINNFLESICKSCDKSKKLAVAILDIDDFKKVNDLFGHQTGDLVIKTVANIISSNVRKNDMVGRYGGEEFLIIFDNIKYIDCINTSERIRNEIQRTSFTDSNYSVTVSIGLTSYKCEGSQSMIKRSDKLMYDAKANGKNQICHDINI